MCVCMYLHVLFYLQRVFDCGKLFISQFRFVYNITQRSEVSESANNGVHNRDQLAKYDITRKMRHVIAQHVKNAYFIVINSNIVCMELYYKSTITQSMS